MLQRIVRQLFAPICIVLGMLLAAAYSTASPDHILIVVSSEEGVYADIAQQLESSSALHDAQYQVASAAKNSLYAQIEPATAIITIGSLAADVVYQHKPSAPVLSALLTESGFNYLAEKHYGSIEQALQYKVSAIYLDQPLERLYQLGKLLLPGSQRIGIVSSDASTAATVNAFSEGLPQEESINTVMLSNDSGPIRMLEPLMRSSDFIIALPGKRSIALSAAKWILQIGSNTRTPVIAYSRKYAISGALAAVYTSPEDVAEQVINVFSSTRGLQAGSAAVFGPDGFSIEINSTVANALGITGADATDLGEEIRRMEGKP